MNYTFHTNTLPEHSKSYKNSKNQQTVVTYGYEFMMGCKSSKFHDKPILRRRVMADDGYLETRIKFVGS